MMMRTSLLFCLLTFGTTLSSHAEDLVPARKQAAILARVLTYDRNLKGWTGDAITIGIVYRTEDGTSESVGNDMYHAFEDLESRTVQDLPMQVVKHRYQGTEDLGGWVTKKDIDLLYLATGLAEELNVLFELCIEKGVIPAAATRAYVEKGAAIGVVLKGRKPSILVNLPMAKSFGMDLDPKVLQLAEVLREGRKDATHAK